MYSFSIAEMYQIYRRVKFEKCTVVSTLCKIATKISNRTPVSSHMPLKVEFRS